MGDELAGPGGLTEKANTFGERDVLREYAAAAAQGARVGEVRDRGARFAGRGDVLTTTAGELTTEDLVAAEGRLIAAAVGRAGEGSAVSRAACSSARWPGADRPLTEEQAGAVRAVARSGNGVDVVEALAGTGKTFIAGTLRHVYEDAGYRVIGVAPTGRAVRELAEEAGVAAWTLDRALLDLEAATSCPKRTVVLLDEGRDGRPRAAERADRGVVEHSEAQAAGALAADLDRHPAERLHGARPAASELLLVAAEEELVDLRLAHQATAPGRGPPGFPRTTRCGPRLPSVHRPVVCWSSAIATFPVITMPTLVGSSTREAVTCSSSRSRGERWVIDVTARESRVRERRETWTVALAAHARIVDGEVGDANRGFASSDARRACSPDTIVAAKDEALRSPWPRRSQCGPGSSARRRSASRSVRPSIRPSVVRPPSRYFRGGGLLLDRSLPREFQVDGCALAGRDSAQIRPPWASTIARAIASPRPLPPLSRERLSSAR